MSTCTQHFVPRNNWFDGLIEILLFQKLQSHQIFFIINFYLWIFLKNVGCFGSKIGIRMLEIRFFFLSANTKNRFRSGR